MSSSTYSLTRHLQQTDMRTTKRDAAKSAAKAAVTGPLAYLVQHPELATSYALPVALSTIFPTLLSLLPLGALGPALGFLAVAFGRFKLRQEVMGGYYALLHSAGLVGIGAQVMSLLSFMGLEASGSAGATWFKSLVSSTVGMRTPLVGLALSAVSAATGSFGVLPSVLGASSSNLFLMELRSFAVFQGLSWTTRHAQTSWFDFVASSWETKVAFLARLVKKKKDGDGKNSGGKDGNADTNDQEQEDWARKILGTMTGITDRLPIASIKKAKDAVADKVSSLPYVGNKTAHEPKEPIDEWVEMEYAPEKASQVVNDNAWTSFAYEKAEDMEASTYDLGAYLAKAHSEDFSTSAALEEIEMQNMAARAAFEEAEDEDDTEAERTAFEKLDLGDCSTVAWQEEADASDDDDDDMEIIELEDGRGWRE